MTHTKKKLAILGGGMGALSAAHWLTSAPGWQDHYDITLYQMGWRLGGKAASSRNPNPAYPPTQAAAARKIAVEFMNCCAGIYWPHSQTPRGFRWEWLVDGHEPGAEGDRRFDQQFWRANIDPSERYVLSVVGSSRYRLPAGGSGFDNLVLAGDWIKTGLDCGCMEATVMSGMQTSRALCGYPAEVPGEQDFGSAPGHRHHTRFDHLLRTGHHAPPG